MSCSGHQSSHGLSAYESSDGLGRVIVVRGLLKSSVRGERILLGTLNFSRDPAVVEVMGHAGLDFVVIDLEHGALDLREVEENIRAADAVGLAPLVRLGERAPTLISRVLDIGAQGLVVPHVSSGRDAAAVVSMTRYPPDGQRPTCTGVRCVAYGAKNYAAHVAASNESLMVLAMIEDDEGVQNIGEIVQVPGIDGIIPGPGDLATTLGVPGQFHHPRVQAAVEKIIHTAQTSDAVVGIYITDVEEIDHWKARGIRLFIYSIDFKVALKGYSEAVARLDLYRNPVGAKPAM